MWCTFAGGEKNKLLHELKYLNSRWVHISFVIWILPILSNEIKSVLDHLYSVQESPAISWQHAVYYWCPSNSLPHVAIVHYSSLIQAHCNWCITFTMSTTLVRTYGHCEVWLPYRYLKTMIGLVISLNLIVVAMIALLTTLTHPRGPVESCTGAQ